jgi:hypothetical protein
MAWQVVSKSSLIIRIAKECGFPWNDHRGLNCHQVTYMQQAAYTCGAGNSLDGKPDGGTGFERVCRSDGSLKSESSCRISISAQGRKVR